MLVNASELTKVLNIVAKYISASSLSPNGSNIRLTVQNEELTISSCDPSAWVEAKIPVPNAGANGSWIVQGRTFAEAIPKVSKDTDLLAIEVRENSISVHGKYEMSFTAQPNEISSMEEFTDKYKVTATQLKGLISKAKIAVPKAHHIHQLNGIYLEKSDGTLSAVATDGVTLSWAKIENTGGEDLSLVLPAKPLDTATKIFPGDATITVSERNGVISLSADNIKIFIPSISRTYVGYKEIISRYTQSPIGRITVEKSKMEEVLEAALTVSTSEEHPVIKIYTGPGEQELHFSLEGTMAKFSGKIPAKREGECKQINVNCEFLRDIVDSITAEKIELHLFADDYAPLMLKPAESEEHISILMPIATKTNDYAKKEEGGEEAA